MDLDFRLGPETEIQSSLQNPELLDCTMSYCADSQQHPFWSSMAYRSRLPTVDGDHLDSVPIAETSGSL